VFICVNPWLFFVLVLFVLTWIPGAEKTSRFFLIKAFSLGKLVVTFHPSRPPGEKPLLSRENNAKMKHPKYFQILHPEAL
jgi:hypothetical protein